MSLVAIVASDLIIATRIADAARSAGHEAVRVDDPAGLPTSDSTAVAFVDWSIRGPGWGESLVAWRSRAAKPPRLVVFGPHVDVEAHHAARSAGIGPMLARSKLITALPDLLPEP